MDGQGERLKPRSTSPIAAGPVVCRLRRETALRQPSKVNVEHAPSPQPSPNVVASLVSHCAERAAAPSPVTPTKLARGDVPGAAAPGHQEWKPVYNSGEYSRNSWPVQYLNGTLWLYCETLSLAYMARERTIGRTRSDGFRDADARRIILNGPCDESGSRRMVTAPAAPEPRRFVS